MTEKMKIVSLQSVGLGAVFSGGPYVNGAGFNEPYTVEVGQTLYDGCGHSLDVTIDKIEYQGDFHSPDNKPPFSVNDGYLVFTSDKHVRVFPAREYIADFAYENKEESEK